MKVALLLLLPSVVQAAITPLPDPSITVNLRYPGTTYVTVDGMQYVGASQFVYFSECAKPDGPRYHCNINVETDVPLYSATGASIVVSITAQFASTLITSGHNWWRQTQTVLDGSVTTP